MCGALFDLRAADRQPYLYTTRRPVRAAPPVGATFLGGRGWGGARRSGAGGGVKAEWVCRLVLLGVCMCSLFEEGILHAWMGGGWLSTRWVGEGGGFNKLQGRGGGG